MVPILYHKNTHILYHIFYRKFFIIIKKQIVTKYYAAASGHHYYQANLLFLLSFYFSKNQVIDFCRKFVTQNEAQIVTHSIIY